jgi:hypothetical protein
MTCVIYHVALSHPVYLECSLVANFVLIIYNDHFQLLGGFV